MRNGIMGSETEFGLVPKQQGDDVALLSFLSRKVFQSYLAETNFGSIEELEREVNWWKENLDVKEDMDRDDRIANVVRRMGMSGEYLANGARFYVDCYHPEYSTPECRTPWELAAHEFAGERIVARAEKENGSNTFHPL